MALEPRIIESIDNIRIHRSNQIIDNLKSIAKKTDKIITNDVSVGARSFIIGVSDVKEMGNNYHDWRFKTYLSDFRAMYYERWIPYDKNNYFLDRMYFHLYKMDRENLIDEEYILLHCDAGEPQDSDHFKYKLSPHLHIKSSEYPIPKAHIALNNGNVNDIINSMGKLNMAMSQGISMIENQILFPQI